MKKLLPIIFFFASLSMAYSQNFVVRGQVQNKAGDPLRYASVLLRSGEDSTLVKGGYTDESGKFALQVMENGNFFLEIKMLGYESINTNLIYSQEKRLELGTLTLKEADASLDEVRISAIRPIIEVQADKTVFNVENSLAASGTSGFELLRKAPGIIIDNNNNLIVEGKSGVQIFIDGKPSILGGDDLTAYLQSLQASDIESIEIITQPSSRYDAAGTAGIINIKLKRDKGWGFNGSLNTGYAYGRNFRNNHSISLNHRGKQMASYLNYSNKFGQSWDFMNLYREQSGKFFNSETENLRGGNVHNLKMGADIFAGERSTFGVIAGGNLNDSWIRGRTETPIVPFGADAPEQILIANNRSSSKSQNLFANLNYRFEDTLGRKWSIDLDYGGYKRDRSSYQPNTYFDGAGEDILFEQNYQMYTPNQVELFSAKTDLEHGLFGGTLALGGKLSLVKTDNTFDFYNVVDGEERYNEDRSNNFKYTEQINAGYVNFNRKFSKINLQLGLRVEQTISEGILTASQQNQDKEVRRNYVNFFPSGGLTYQANWENQFAFNYSRRIKRPGYQSLNPFEYQVDELSFSRGNPFLQPQYADNFRLSYTYKYAATLAVSYSYTSGFFAQVTDVLDERRSFMQVQNIADNEVYNLSLSVPYDFTKWWSFYASLNGYYSAFDSENEKFDPIDRASMSFYAQNNFSLPAGFRFEISGWFSSPSVWGGTYRTKSLGSLDLGLQKKFLKDKLTVSLSMGDVLFTSPWRGVTQFGELRITGTGGWESRSVRLNLSYDFGNKDLKAARERKLGSKEEADRVN